MNSRDLSMFIKFLKIQAIAKANRNNDDKSDSDNDNTESTTNNNNTTTTTTTSTPVTSNNTTATTTTSSSIASTPTTSNNNNNTTPTTTTTTTPNPNKTCKCKSLNERTHTYCSTNCGCSKNGTGCNSKCLCKGQCGNGKSISDELFFRVWRNIVIRNEIIGERRDLIRECEEKKAKVVDVLLKKHGCSFPNSHWSRSYIRRNGLLIDSIADAIVQDIKTHRTRDVQNALRNVGIIYRHNDHGDSIKSFIQTMDEEKRKQLPTIDTLVEIEKDQLKNRKQTFIDRLTLEGLEPFKETSIIREYLSSANGEISIETVLSGIRQNFIREKLVNLGLKLSKKGFILRKDHPEVKKYILVFKPDEIKSLKVKTEEEIIKQEIEYNKKRRILFRELAKNGLYFRKSNTAMVQYLDGIIELPAEFTIEKLVQDEITSISMSKKYREEVLQDRLQLRGIPGYKVKTYEMFDHYLNGSLKGTEWDGDSVDDLISIYQEVAKDTADHNSTFIYRNRNGYKENGNDDDEEDSDHSFMYGEDDDSDEEEDDDDDNGGEYDSDYYTDDSDYCYNCKTYH